MMLHRALAAKASGTALTLQVCIVFANNFGVATKETGSLHRGTEHEHIYRESV